MTTHPNRSKIRPQKHMIAMGKKYPEIWGEVDSLRRSKGKDSVVWPNWCFLPVAGAYTIMANGIDENCSIDTAGNIACLAAWRVTQTVYRFDPSFLATLPSTTTNLKPDRLYHLPEWCVYIETSGLTWFDNPLAGFFCHLENNSKTGSPVLCLLIDCANSVPGQLISVSLTMGRQSVTREDVDVSTIQILLSMILYICEEQSDIGSGQVGRPKAKKTKEGWKLFPAAKPSIVQVGYNIGQSMHDKQSLPHKR